MEDVKANVLTNGLSDYLDHSVLEKSDVECSKLHGLNGSTLAKVVTHSDKIQNGDADTIMEIDDEVLVATGKM